MEDRDKDNSDRVAYEHIRGTELKPRSSVHTECAGAGLQSQLLGRIKRKDRVQVQPGRLSEDCLFKKI